MQCNIHYITNYVGNLISWTALLLLLLLLLLLCTQHFFNFADDSLLVHKSMYWGTIYIPKLHD